MKVRELMKKVHLTATQKVKLNDCSTASTHITEGRYDFGYESEEVERLLSLKVNSFAVNDNGLVIWAE